MRDYSLNLLSADHAALKRHLFPGDGFEAAAILICRRVGADNERFIVRRVLPVPHAACTQRTPVAITWPGAFIESAIDIAEAGGDSIILTHSHPGGQFAFSATDDASDQNVLPSVFHAFDGDGALHGSAIMTPSGAMKARLYDHAGTRSRVARITRIGQGLTPLSDPSLTYGLPFGDEMRQALARMTACVIGVSGTGSLVAEQLARMGVGRLILIDFDTMGPENLNRIANSTVADARNKSLKPDMMAAAIKAYNSDIEIVSVGKPIETVEAIQAAASADILFSCVDRMDARLIAERLCGACLIPLIDVGVTIPTRKDAAGAVHVAEIAGRIDYVRPDGPSLTDRRVVTPEGLRRDYLIDHAPQTAKVEIEAGYLKGAPDEAPAVMSVNMRAAATAVNEWLARLYGFRVDGNAAFARTLFLLASGEEEYARETEFPYAEHAYFGQGLAPPLLGLPGLAESSERAAA